MAEVVTDLVDRGATDTRELLVGFDLGVERGGLDRRVDGLEEAGFLVRRAVVALVVVFGAAVVIVMVTLPVFDGDGLVRGCS